MNEYDIPAEGEEVKPVSKPAEYFSRFGIQMKSDPTKWIGSEVGFGPREKMRIFFTRRSANTYLAGVREPAVIRELIIVVKPEGE